VLRGRVGASEAEEDLQPEPEPEPETEAATPPPSPVAQATLAPPDAAGADLIGQQKRKIDQLEADNDTLSAENKKLKS